MKKIGVYIVVLIFLVKNYNLNAQTHHFDSISNVNYQILHNANLNDCWGYG